jgi:hypothetical protein
MEFLSLQLIKQLYKLRSSVKIQQENLQEDDLNELFLFVKSNPLDFNIKLQNSANLINAVYFSISSVISYKATTLFLTLYS